MQLSLLKQIWFMTRYAFYGLFLQSLLFSLLIAKEGNAQRVKLEDVKLSIELNEVQLADAFIQIEQEVGFNFVLKRTLLNKKKKVSVSPKEQSMMELLTYLSKLLGFSNRKKALRGKS